MNVDSAASSGVRRAEGPWLAPPRCRQPEPLLGSLPRPPLSIHAIDPTDPLMVTPLLTADPAL